MGYSSPAALARASNTSANQITNLESGRSNPPVLGLLMSIAAIQAQSFPL